MSQSVKLAQAVRTTIVTAQWNTEPRIKGRYIQVDLDSLSDAAEFLGQVRKVMGEGVPFQIVGDASGTVTLELE